MMRAVLPLVALSLGLAPPAQAAESLQQRVEARLAQAATGTRFGLVVAAENGRELIAIAPDARFIPASNTKMFTTAAAFATLPAVDQPDATGGAAVRLDESRGRSPDVVLIGNGDARLSSAARLHGRLSRDARRRGRGEGAAGERCDRRRHSVPRPALEPGHELEQHPSSDGTGISALTIDDNRIALRVVPATAGAAPAVELATPYYTVINQAVTVAGGKTDLNVDRLPFDRTLRLIGTIAADATPEIIGLGIDDPAHYAAWRLKGLLEARGVKVGGVVRAVHRPRRDDRRSGEAGRRARQFARRQNRCWRG